jgi:hypothetical protein
LRIASITVGRKVYELIGASSEQVCSSAGIRVMPDTSMADAGRFGAVSSSSLASFRATEST